MNDKEKQELAADLSDIKDLVDEFLPLESSVVRDQILASLVAIRFQARFLPAQASSQVGEQVTNSLMSAYESYAKGAAQAANRTVAAQLTEATSRMVKEEEKVSSKSARRMVKNTYQGFLKMLEEEAS